MYISSIYGIIMDFHNDQFLVILVVQLVKCCTGIALVLVRDPIRGPFLESLDNFSGPVVKSQSAGFETLLALNVGKTKTIL